MVLVDLTMGDGTMSMADGLGFQALDSNEVRRKQRNAINLQTNSWLAQAPNSGNMPDTTTPARFSDLGSDVRDTPLMEGKLQSTPQSPILNLTPSEFVFFFLVKLA